MPVLKNIRHEKAIQAFLSNGGNKSAAYREVYKGSVKWKDKTVWERSSRLFSEYKVDARVKELQEKLSEKQIISKEAMIKDLEKIAEVTIADFVLKFNDESGELVFKPIDEWTPVMNRACSGIKKGKNGTELTVHGMKYSYDRISKLMGYDAPVKSEVKDTTFEDLIGLGKD